MGEAERTEIHTPDLLLSAMTTALEEGRFPRIPSASFCYAFFRYGAEAAGIDGFDTYFSTAITSGGAALPDREGGTLPFGEALNRNKQYALDLAAAVMVDNAGLLSPATAVNPVTLGRVPVYHYENYGVTKVHDGYWGQDDFLRFWFAVILGLKAAGSDPQDTWLKTELHTETLFAVHKDTNVETARTMNDKTASVAERHAAYSRFTGTFLVCVDLMQQQGTLSADPVKRIVELIDTRRSLGCRSELELGRRRGIPLLQLALTGDDWERRGLSRIAGDLEARDATFAAASGRLVLAMNSGEQPDSPSPEGAITNEVAARRLSDPLRDCIDRFMAAGSVRNEATLSEEELFFYKVLPAEYEFSTRRPAAYKPEVARAVLGL